MPGEMIEQKTITFEMKEISDEGVLRGHAAAIGNVDEGGDIILPGAFDKSLKRSNGIMPVYWGHSWDRIPLGYGTSATADEKYMHVEGALTMTIPSVKDAFESMKHAKQVGFKMGLSIGFRIAPKGYEFIEDGRVRQLKEIDVFEWSVTPFPMNRRAGVTALKSMLDTLDIEHFTERDLEQFARDAFELSQREAKTFISRLRVLFSSKTSHRDDDAGPGLTMPAPLQSVRERIDFDRWMAEQRSRLHS